MIDLELRTSPKKARIPQKNTRILWDAILTIADEYELIALHPAQVREWSLPTRPGKHSDSRHKAFAAKYGDASVELDAVPPNVLTALVRHAIESQIEDDEWQRMQEVEALERRTLASIALIGFEPGVKYGSDEAA